MTEREAARKRQGSAQRYARLYTLYGVLFGSIFPIGSTVFDAIRRLGELSFGAMLEAQLTSPLLWVIDTAPIFLGIVASFAGRRQDALNATLLQLRRSNRRLEAANVMLEATNERLIEASQVKTQFLANMSHELRTPLNAIIGFTRIVIRKTAGKVEQRQWQNLKLVLQSAEHLLEMVNDLLDIERIEAGMVAVSDAEVEVGDLLDDLTARFRPVAAERGLSFETRNLLRRPRIRTDPVRLRQVLDNLVNNAIKYSEQGRIEVLVSEDRDNLTFTVRDEGVGIESAQLDAIFDPFHQVDGSSTRSRGGVGLGLHLVKKLVELLEGRVYVESEPSKGSAFAVEFPRELVILRDRSVAGIAPTLTPSPVPVHGPTVLVIDDDPRAIEIMHNELLQGGFRVFSALSGEHGLQKARKIRPNLIVLDMVMPRMDGWAVLKALREDQKLATIPVVVVSMLDEVPSAREQGVFAWLTKPVTTEDFRAVFERMGGEQGDDVLVVEDHHPTGRMVRQYLEDVGASVRIASSGDDAIAAIAHRMPRVIVLDLLLPGVDGLEVLQQLRQIPGGEAVAVVIYTARELSGDELARIERVGAVHVFQKGASRSVGGLVEVVQKVLNEDRKRPRAFFQRR